VTAPDWHELFAERIAYDHAMRDQGAGWGAGFAAADLLGAKEPELCPTCGGFGMVPQCHPEHHAQGDGCGCPANFMPCPDCPTIGTLLAEAAAARELARTHGVTPAKLLAIGAAAWTGVRDGDVRLTATERQLNRMDRDEIHADYGKKELLDELRAVEP